MDRCFLRGIVRRLCAGAMGRQGSSSCVGEGGTTGGTRARSLAYVTHKIPVIGAAWSWS